MYSIGKTMKNLLILLLVALSISCQTPQVPIDTTEWRLVKMYDEDFSSIEQPITIQFSAPHKEINGFAGCNRFFGNYELAGAAIKISGMGSTKMFCQDTMIVEDNYFKALGDVESYKLKGDKLFLLKDNSVILEFIR